MRNKKINLQKIENEFNKNIEQFMLIYARMKEEPELKKLETDKNVREYRKEAVGKVKDKTIKIAFLEEGVGA